MGTTQSSEAIIPHAHILPFSYQIDLRKLRFYHAKHITTSVGGTDGIVWHALIATSKRMVDILMFEYGIFNFATDAVYLGAIWSKFALELLL